MLIYLTSKSPTGYAVKVEATAFRPRAATDRSPRKKASRILRKKSTATTREPPQKPAAADNSVNNQLGGVTSSPLASPT